MLRVFSWVNRAAVGAYGIDRQLFQDHAKVNAGLSNGFSISLFSQPLQPEQAAALVIT